MLGCKKDEAKHQKLPRGGHARCMMTEPGQAWPTGPLFWLWGSDGGTVGEWESGTSEWEWGSGLKRTDPLSLTPAAVRAVQRR